MNWKPIDYIVAAMVLSIMIVVATVSFEYILGGSQMSEAGAKRFSGIITSMLSIIAMYVGAKIQEGRDQGNKL